jgi:hypothetical protein
MNTTISKWLTALVLLSWPVIRTAEAVTYNFTGSVYEASDSFGAAYLLGVQSVYGTFTLDYGSANPSQTTGTIGSPDGWSVANGGEQFPGGSGLAPLFFSVTVYAAGTGQVLFAPSLVGAFADSSSAWGGSLGTAATNSGFKASEFVAPILVQDYTANLTLTSYNGAAAFLSNGQPNFQLADQLGQVEIVLNGHGAVGTLGFNLESVTPAQPLTLVCPAASAQTGVPYSSALSAAGGLPAYTFSISSGSLPAGLTLDTSTGALTGTPTAAGPFSFTAQVVDSSKLAVGTITSNCTITVSPPPVRQQLAALLTEVTGVGPGKSLENKVALAQMDYAAKDVQATCAMLTAFVNEVHAQAGRKISPQLDAKLIADAQAIEAAIGCN